MAQDFSHPGILGSLFADATGSESLQWKSGDLKAASFFKGPLEGKTPRDIFDQESAEIFLDQYRMMLKTKADRIFQINYRKGRTSRLIQIALVPFVDSSFTIQQVICHLYDLSSESEKRKSPDAAIAISQCIEDPNDAAKPQQKNEPSFSPDNNYFSLLESFSDIILECDRHGKILSINEKGAAFFGKKSDKIIHKWLDDFFHFEDTESFTQWLNKATKTPLNNFEMHTVLAGRLYSTVNCFIVPKPTATKTASGFYLAAVDISQQRRALQEYKAIYDSSRDGIILFQSGSILRVNKAAARQFGVGDPKQFVGKNIIDIIHPNYRRQVVSYLTPQSGDLNVSYIPAVRGLRNDESTFELEISISVISYEDEPIFMLITRDVTERNVAVALLKQSEEFFRALIEHSPDFIVLTDKNGRTMYVNPVFTKLLGHDPAVLKNRNPITFIHPKDRRKCIRALLEVVQKKEPVGVECRIPSIQGEWLEFEALIVPLIGSENDIDQFFISARDVSLRQKTQSIVSEKEKRYRALFESAGDGLFVYNTKGVIVNVNQSGCRMVGYSIEELIGEDIRYTLFPEDVQQATGDPYMYVANPQPEERRLRKKDGSEIWVHWKTSVFETEGELALLVIKRDITDEHRLREELAFEHAFGEAVLQSLEPLRVINIDTWNVVSVNPKAEEYFTKASKRGGAFISCNHIGNTNVQCIDPDCPIHLAINNNAPTPVERFIESDDTWLWMCGYPFTVSGHQYVAEMIRDVTAQKKMEESLAHAQKMEAIGTLAGGIAHDFNNLLGGIIGFTSLAKLKLDQNHQLFRAIDSIEKSAQRAAKLTEQLLDFARAGRIQVEPLHINSIVESVLALVERTFQKKITLKKKLDSALWQMEGDSGQIEHVVLNLCINARDAIAEKNPTESVDTIAIETFNKVVDDSIIDVPSNIRHGSYVCLSVRDTGIGIDPDIKARIFEPFFTTKSDAKGTGLGLSMVYGIMQAHNGYIQVDSEPGKGSTFILYFPALTELVDAIPQTTIQEFINGSGTIILADDEELMRDAAKEILEELGYNVVTASNGKEAIELFRNTPNVLLVVLDMIMPGISGIDVYMQIKKTHPKQKVLFTSGYYLDARARRFIESGEVDFLQKPYTVDALAEKLAEVIEK